MRQGTDRPDISERLNGSHAEGDYDALADLFLGGEPAKTGANTPRPPTLVNPATSPAAPAHHADLGMPHGPCCSRVGPIGGAATAKHATRRIDVLFLGSLPGLGGTWASQHARTIAMQLDAPACLLRLAEGQLVVDLIWPDNARPPVFPACADAAAALGLAAQHAGAWILRVQGQDQDALAELFAESRPGPDGVGTAADRVRLLTGADDTAIVAAYGRLKAWHAASPLTFGRLARVTIVEPDSARAGAAEARLRKAAASFLETELAPAEFLGAMRPVRVTTLYCGPFESTAPQTLAMLRKISAQVAQVANATAAPASSPNGAPLTPANGVASADPARAAASNGASNGASNATHTPPATNGVHAESAPARAPASPAASPHAPSANAAPRSIQSAPPGTHAPTTDQIISMIARSAGIDTLRAASTNCPWAPAIVLTVDTQGESHAIAFARDEAHVALAAVDLLTASRWCAEHASLLAMAGVTPRASDTTLHLLTTTPAAARRLIDTGLRIHAAVRIGESWGAVSLS